MAKQFHYGGQAVIEGVMMRGQKAVVTAVRKPDGELDMNVQPLPRFYTSWMRRTPLLRGIVVLIEALYLGIKSLLYSANVSLEEEETQLSGWMVWAIVAASLAIGVGLFFLVPLFLAGLFLDSSSIWFYVTEGVLRIIIFIIYLKLVSLMPDIKQVFAYHGAEHKTINAYEHGVPLEVAEIRVYGTAHRRCGTSFLLVVMVIAIFTFAIIGSGDVWFLILSRVILLPLIAALSYEVILFGANHANNRIVGVLILPGLWLQSMTTRQPDDGQIEVALSALRKAVEVDQLEETV